MEIHGISYRSGAVVRLPPKEFEPVFGRITNIYILSDIKYFEVEVLFTHSFVPHFFSYHVSFSNNVDVVQYTDLLRYGVLHLHHVNGMYLVSERDTVDVECVT